MYCSYPCSLLIQSAARRDHQVTVRLGHSLGIYRTINREKQNVSFYWQIGTQHTRSINQLFPQRGTLTYTKRNHHMSRGTRTGELLGGVAAAEEVARRLRLPELLPKLAPAALQTIHHEIRRNDRSIPPSEERMERTEHGILHSRGQRNPRRRLHFCAPPLACSTARRSKRWGEKNKSRALSKGG